MRLAGFAAACVLGGCGFHAPGTAVEPDLDAPAADAASDTALPAALCDDDPAVLVCFSFDAATLPATLANEGTASVSAVLAGVTRIDRGAGGAAMVGTASQIRIPPNNQTMGIISAEAWVRIDAEPVTERVGIMDADATSSAVSFFYYALPTHQLRFEIGQQLFVDYTATFGTWIYLAEVCDANTLTAYVDGHSVGARIGCSAGNATTYGLQLGQNNNQVAGDQWLVGALDGVRLWTRPLTADEICRTAGPACHSTTIAAGGGS